jgi:Mg2+ and Co2+ transporter CorA
MRPPSTSRLRSRRIDYLLYGIVDFVIDAAFPVLEEFGVEIEQLEEVLLDAPGSRCDRADSPHPARAAAAAAHAVAAARAREPAAA